jgi:anti-anti-sigma factor
VWARAPGPNRSRILAEKRPEPPVRLEIEVSHADQKVVVRLRGEAGVAEASMLETALVRVLARRPACVLFDLSELRFLSSLAMGALASYQRAAVRAGARVCRATALHPMVREALERAELLGIFEVIDGAEPGGGSGPAESHARKWYPSADELQRAHGITWGQLIELEPEVEALLWRARQAGAHCRTGADVRRAFHTVRQELTGLIGFFGKHHRDPVLGSVGAYEVAYWKLYDALAALVLEHTNGPEKAPGLEKPEGAPCFPRQ